MKSRLLTPTDLPQITEIITSHTHFIRAPMPDERMRAMVSVVSEHIQSAPNAYAFGAFDGDQLKSILYTRKWAGFPYYNLEGMFIRPGNEYFSLDRSGLASLFDTATRMHEEMGYLRWYYLRDVEAWPVKKLIGQWNKVPAFTRYNLTVEEFLKGGSVPLNRGLAQVVGLVKTDRDRVIVSGSLKQEFRKTNDLQPRE